MGIIRAITGAIGGGLADQWLEVIEAGNMSDSTVFCAGIPVRRGDRRNQNKKGSADVISDGSVIHVQENQFMLLVDGGKVVDYTAEPGYFEVRGSSAPSMLNGQFDKALHETFNRIRFSGVTPYEQKVYFINLQEIKNIAFGTVNPINYFDNFYNAELFLRAHGYFSIRIVEPLKFYAEAIPRNAESVDIQDIHKLYLSEFLNGLQAAINQMSVDNIRISHVASKGVELARYLSTALDEEWTQKRGMTIESVGIQSISYDENSKKLIERRNEGAMLSDPGIREGYVQGAVARGMEAAGSNKNGAMMGFAGLGVGMQAGGGFVGAASAANQSQAARETEAKKQSVQGSWKCSCGQENTGAFCQNCGREKASSGSWKCSCGQENTGNFCSNCGSKRPESGKCPKCGCILSKEANFCPECGQKVK
ncbi:SPFH domain-containing protein [Fumia xinanensis]|uniref:SPFH domain-containing protein n=1 Tax=Fumia xinanensis TaxID=2763659 RepID=A0A926I6F9_9FIRM|nr:SPFH domain-containing protein [Fumia xinanensis]MBC8558811.1 SPFH domain-containing protein [Fumia xinanensis]